MRRGISVIAALALAVCAAACGSGANAEGILRAIDPGVGSQFRLKPADPWKDLTQGTSIPAGSEVRTGPQGSAMLESGGGAFSLGPSTWIQITSAQQTVARTGQVLAESTHEPLTISDGDQHSVSGETGSAFRFDYGSRIADYRGPAHATVTGEHVDLFTGQELLTGLVSPTPHMLVIDRSDPWDKRLLADAIEIDDRLAPFRATFDVNTGGGSATIDFLKSYAPVSQIMFLGPILAGRLKDEHKFDVLVTLLISLEYARSGVPLNKAFATTQGLLDSGASFGLAAYVLGIKASSLVQDVLVALSPHAPGAVVPTTPAQPQPGGGPTPTPTFVPSPTPSPTPSRTSSPTPTPTPTQTQSHSPSPTPSPSSSCSVVDQLTGACHLAPI
ncbi:MAG: hypothetical protein ACYDCC_16125 [Actinomycetota bacterium]